MSSCHVLTLLCNDLQVAGDPQMSLKGTQVSSNQKQSSLLSPPAKPQLPGAPASSSRMMRNTSSLRAKGGDVTFPGLAELVTVGPDSVPAVTPGLKVCHIVG